MAHKSLSVSSLPQISLADHLLSSKIPLPSDPCVAYALFTPDANSPVKHSESIELARRHILLKNASSLFTQSLLSNVQIGANSFMYVFLIAACDCIADATETLGGLYLDGLTSESRSPSSLHSFIIALPSGSILFLDCYGKP